MHLPNPFTPLAYLPPAQADEFQVTGYVCIASLGVGISIHRIDLQRMALDAFTGIYGRLADFDAGGIQNPTQGQKQSLEGLILRVTVSAAQLTPISLDIYLIHLPAYLPSRSVSSRPYFKVTDIALLLSSIRIKY